MEYNQRDNKVSRDQESSVSFRNDIDYLQVAMRVAGIGIWEFGLAEKQIIWDDACRALYDVPSGHDLSYDELLACIHPEDANRVEQAFLAALRGENNGHYDVQFRTIGLGDRKLRWVRFCGQSVFDANGTLTRFGGIAQDVSILIQATQSALEAQTLSEMALQNAGAGSFRVHLETNQIEYSPSLARIYTGDDSMIIDREMLIAHIHPDDQASRLDAYRKAEQTGKLFYEARTVWKDGSIHWIEARGNYIPGPNGKPLVFAGVVQDVTERKLAHLATEQRERQLFDSFYQAPVGIAIIGKDHLTFRMANAFYAQLVGRMPEQLVGKPLLDALPELQGQGFDTILRDVLETGNAYIQYAAPVSLTRNGAQETIYVDFIYQAMRNAQEELSDILVVVTDVTNQFESRKQLAASEAKFRSLIEEAPFATALYAGDDLTIDTANAAMIELWGKTSDVIGMPLAWALPELDGQPFIGLLQEIRKTGETYHARSAPADLFVNGELRRFWFSYTYKPLYDEGGKVYAILNMALDVTDDVVSRKKLEDTQGALINAIELAELGTWSLDIRTGDIVVSDRMKDWFGLAAEAGALDDAVDAIVEQDRDRVAEAIAEAIKPGAGRYSEEYRVRNRRTGQLLTIHAQGRAALDSHGLPIRLEGTARNVTMEREMQLALERLVQERTEELAATNEELQATNEELQATNEELADANERLIHSNEELAQYAYVASHDLQEPLRKIRVFSGMLDQSKTLQTDERGLLGKITYSAERMAMLIKDLLEFSKLLNSEAIWHPVELEKTVAAIRSDFELIIAEKGANIEIGALPKVDAVGLQMNQLFYNLIGNALKFVQPGVAPRISISAEPISHEEAAQHIGKVLLFANYYRISVRDNGIGFDVAYTEQIFEVFKRLHGREIYPGSGIGLALCRRIVANHMGALYAESVLKEGSVFHVILPDKREPFISSLPMGFKW